jgi:mannose-6-phosphate isomerase-like protein (cupin superfamily)
MAVSKEVRRVVTGLDAEGKAVVLYDGANPHNFVRPNRANVSRLLWITDKIPADISGDADRAARTIGVPPPDGGSILRIVDVAPITPEVEALPKDYLAQQIGDHAPQKGMAPSHPLMHRTRTIDYAIIMEGEIDMLLDDSEIHLKAGDVLIQQGTNHAWVNRSGEVCRIAFILIDAEEPA